MRRAAQLAQAGRYPEAVSAWEQVNRLDPAKPTVAARLGAALLGAERFADALDWLSAASDQHPNDALLIRLHAEALLKLGHRRPAIGALFLALELDPTSAETKGELATALTRDGAGRIALPYAEAAFAALPATYAPTLGSILLELGRAKDVLAVVDKGLRLGAPPGPLLILRSMALEAIDRRDEALEVAREAVRVAPKDPNTLHGLAASLLIRGELTEEAWALYEQRGAIIGMREWPAQERRWTGGDVIGRTVLVHAEQGLGDTLQFVRYVPMVAARGAKVVLVVQKPLVRLLQGMPGADVVTTTGVGLPPFDLYCPLLSLPGLFATTLDTIPPPVPYPLAQAPRSEETLRVGVVWAGSTNFAYNSGRSLDPALLAPLADVQGVTFHNLQFGAAELPLPGMIDLMQGVADFAETAARIAELDLVIAVDTSVAHLAATMGKPVWLLSRFHGCWRWLLDREDTPWYPTMRIYRQRRPTDWADVIERVRGDLARLAAAAEVTPLAA